MSILYGGKPETGVMIGSGDVASLKSFTDLNIYQGGDNSLPWWAQILTGTWAVDALKGAADFGIAIATGTLEKQIYDTVADIGNIGTKEFWNKAEPLLMLGTAFIPVVGPAVAGSWNLIEKGARGEKISGADIVGAAAGGGILAARGISNYRSYSTRSYVKDNLLESLRNAKQANSQRQMPSFEWEEANGYNTPSADIKFTKPLTEYHLDSTIKSIENSRKSIFNPIESKLSEKVRVQQVKTVEMMKESMKQATKGGLEQGTLDRVNNIFDSWKTNELNPITNQMMETAFRTDRRTVSGDDYENSLRASLLKRGLSTNEISMFISKLKSVAGNKADVIRLFEEYGFDRKSMNAILKDMGAKRIKNLYVEYNNLSQRNKTSFAKVRSATKNAINSERFNKTIEWAKILTDTGDTANFAINKVTKVVKRDVERESRKIERELYDEHGLKKGLVKVKSKKKLEEMFLAGGGSLCMSDVIVGYKIMERVGNKYLIMINFYPEPTGAKNMTWNGVATRNFGGKAPVTVTASSSELNRLKTEGMAYYLNRWAVSRGGASTGGDLGVFGVHMSGMAHILPFLNNRTLSNLVKLAMVISKANQEIGEHGLFTSAWSKAVGNQLQRRITNRTKVKMERMLFGHKGHRFLRTTQRMASGNISNSIGRQGVKVARKSSYGKNSTYKNYRSTARTSRQISRMGRMWR